MTIVKKYNYNISTLTTDNLCFANVLTGVVHLFYTQ